MRRLKETVGQFGAASPRQIDLIVARFTQVGHLQVVPAPSDQRMRIVLPTPALIEHDRSFIAAHYRPHGALFGAEVYALPLGRDHAFHKATRAAWVATLGSMARETILKNRPILRFYAASAGMLMLMKLVRLQEQAADGQVALDFTDFGRRFAVSRTHVRMLLTAVAADGDMELDARGRVRVGPGLVAALDRNIAERMSLLDRSHGAALARLAAT